MVNTRLRKSLDAYGAESEEEIKILDSHAYDNSIIGITDDGRLIYDYELMVHEFMEDEECTEEEAVEWLEYNTLRAIPYFGDNAPIVMNISTKTLLDLYGE